MSQISKLDVLSKAIYPGLAILVVLYVYWDGDRKQRQLDVLDAELQTVTRQQQATEQKQKELNKQTEDHAHATRVLVCKGLLQSGFNLSNSPMEEKAGSFIKSWFGFLSSAMRQQDAQNMGDGKARELWDKAEQQAKAELQAAGPGKYPFQVSTVRQQNK